jgi:ferritin
MAEELKLKRSLKNSSEEKSSDESKPASKSKNPLITDKCIEYLNYRIQQEEYSVRVYLAMSMWLDDKGYVNAAKLWKKYSSEENTHADWAREYLISLGVQPETRELEKPNQDFSGLPQIIKDSYDHEVEITNQVKELAAHALEMGDHMLYQLGLQYVKEQVEELGKLQNFLDQLEAFGEDKIAMRLLDHELKDYL